jgi:hypothetical protein
VSVDGLAKVKVIVIVVSVWTPLLGKVPKKTDGVGDETDRIVPVMTTFWISEFKLCVPIMNPHAVVPFKVIDAEETLTMVAR